MKEVKEMKKIKASANVLSMVMLLSLFVDWKWMLIVTVFIWCFCESGQAIKNLIIRCLAVYAGCYLFSWFWDIIYAGYSLGVSGLTGLFDIIAGFGADMSEVVLNVNKYVLSPVAIIFKLLDSAVSFVILLAKFKFIMSVVTNRPLTGIFGKIQEYINYFVNFGNSSLYEDNANVQPQQPQQQMYQQQAYQPNQQ
jgi:hypothetical protein